MRIPPRPPSAAGLLHCTGRIWGRLRRRRRRYASSSSEAGGTLTATRCHALFASPRRFHVSATLAGCMLNDASTARHTSSASTLGPPPSLGGGSGTSAVQSVHAHALDNGWSAPSPSSAAVHVRPPSAEGSPLRPLYSRVCAKSPSLSSHSQLFPKGQSPKNGSSASALHLRRHLRRWPTGLPAYQLAGLWGSGTIWEYFQGLKIRECSTWAQGVPHLGLGFTPKDNRVCFRL